MKKWRNGRRRRTGELLQPAIDLIQSPAELLDFFAELLQFLLVTHRSGYTPLPRKPAGLSVKLI